MHLGSKGKMSRIPCDNTLIGMNNWKYCFLDLTSLQGLEEELSIRGGRRWSPLWSTKLTSKGPFVESHVQKGELKDETRKWTPIRKYMVDHTRGVRLVIVEGEKMKQRSQLQE